MLRAVFTFLFLSANRNISPTFAVTGGEPVRPHEFPFLVSFYEKGAWAGAGSGGGALISPRHVLTCKHCFKGKKAELFEVGFGKTTRAEDEAGVMKRQVERFVFHPTLDAAILVLAAEVPLSEHVKVLGLPEAGSDFSGQNATLAGPGALGPEGPYPEELFMKVLLKVGTEPGKECPSEDNLCATSLRDEPWGSGCNGDSGSPLFICSTSEACTVIALIVGPPGYNKHGNCQGDSGGPSVSFLRSWIDREINKKSADTTPRAGRPMW